MSDNSEKISSRAQGNVSRQLIMSTDPKTLNNNDIKKEKSCKSSSFEKQMFLISLFSYDWMMNRLLKGGSCGWGGRAGCPLITGLAGRSLPPPVYFLFGQCVAEVVVFSGVIVLVVHQCNNRWRVCRSLAIHSVFIPSWPAPWLSRLKSAVEFHSWGLFRLKPGP